MRHRVMACGLGLILGCTSSGRRDEPRPEPRPEPVPPVTSEPVPVDAGAPPPAAPVETVGDPRKLESYATVPREQLSTMADTAKGKVNAVRAAAPKDNRIRWTLEVSEGSKALPFLIELPDGVAFPAKVGDSVVVKASHYGGGPNVIGQIHVTDDKGAVLVAINSLPAGWDVDFGRRLSREKGEPYDSVTHAVKMQPARGKPVALVSDWSAVTIDGARYYGNGTAVKRTLHAGKPAPPDYVGGWIDYALIRVGTAP